MSELDSSNLDGRRDRARALRVGAVVLLAGVVLVALLVVTGPLRVLSGRSVHVDFAYAGPIKPGAAVRCAGVVVGSVEGVDFLGGQDAAAGPSAMVRVRARIEDRASVVVTDRARFYVTTLGVLGEHYLDIEPVAGGKALDDGARVDGVTLARADLLLPRAAALLERANDVLDKTPEMLALLQSTSSLLKRVDELLGDPKNQRDLDHARSLLADLDRLVHGAAVGVGDGKVLRDVLSKLGPTLDDTRALEGELHKIDVVTLAKSGEKTLGTVDHVLAAVDGGLLTDNARQKELTQRLDTTLQALTDVSRRADRLLGVIESKQGAAGKLYFDDDVARDLKAVLRGLRDDPMKFLLSTHPQSKP
jgi:ABC-type transporter Mla subunit MlaD